MGKDTTRNGNFNATNTLRPDSMRTPELEQLQMTAGQRRMLWLVCFGFTYVFWYEASGCPLLWSSNAPSTPLAGLEAHRYYWNHIGFGACFAVLGTFLTFVMKSRVRPAAPYTYGDMIALALAAGALIGTAIRSAMAAGVW